MIAEVQPNLGAYVSECPRGDCTKKPMLADLRVCPGRPWRRAMTATERVIRWSTAAGSALRGRCGGVV